MINNKVYTVVERGTIDRATLPKWTVLALHQEDGERAASARPTIFDWSDPSALRVRHYVGIVQTAEATIEIVPKMYADRTQSLEEQLNLASKNLLYMLRYIKNPQSTASQMASLQFHPGSLSEALMLLYAESLRVELSRNLVHNYEPRHDVLPFLRGGIRFSEQVKLDMRKSVGLAVKFHDFSADTLQNQLVKSACILLLSQCAYETRVLLNECLGYLDDVAEYTGPLPQMEDIALSRQNVAMQPHVEFALKVLGSHRPGVARGHSQTFSILYSMQHVFEEFVGQFVRRHAQVFGHRWEDVSLQADTVSPSYLLGKSHESREDDSWDKLRLKPALMLLEKGSVTVICDTKWKALDKGLRREDLFQIYSYASRFSCANNILLYPRTAKGDRQAQFVLEPSAQMKLKIAFVDLGVDLARQEDAFLAELTEVFCVCCQGSHVL